MHAQAEPAPALVVFVLPHDSCFDSSPDDEMPLQDPQPVQGCAKHGDAVDSTRRFARYVRPCRMSDHSLPEQVYACAPVCGEATKAAIGAHIVARAHPYGGAPRDRLLGGDCGC